MRLLRSWICAYTQTHTHTHTYSHTLHSCMREQDKKRKCTLNGVCEVRAEILESCVESACACALSKFCQKDLTGEVRVGRGGRSRASRVAWCCVGRTPHLLISTHCKPSNFEASAKTPASPIAHCFMARNCRRSQASTPSMFAHRSKLIEYNKCPCVRKCSMWNIAEKCQESVCSRSSDRISRILHRGSCEESP